MKTVLCCEYSYAVCVCVCVRQQMYGFKMQHFSIFRQVKDVRRGWSITEVTDLSSLHVPPDATQTSWLTHMDRMNVVLTYRIPT